MQRSVVLLAALLAVLVGVVSGCPGTLSPRSQLLVFVDTDAHVVGELASRPEVSSDAAMDTLRVDVIDATTPSAPPYALNTFVVADVSAWPLSLGVVPPTSGGDVLLRLRLFRAEFASTGTGLDQATLVPPAEVTIDRLVAVAAAPSGIDPIRVVLAEDCLGAASSPAPDGGPSSTCIDATQVNADPHQGVQQLGNGAPPASLVGTWAPAIEVPCKSTPASKRVCIPGGFAILGDLDALGVASDTFEYEPVPLRPVEMSPFILDQYEFTVGQARTLVNQGALPNYEDLIQPYTAPMTPSFDPNFVYCTWLGPTDPSNDGFPLNCIKAAGVQQLCASAAANGALPTEAQWEYAARGRGQRREYPSGNTPPSCCTASAGRHSDYGDGGSSMAGSCGLGVEPIGSHPISAACGDAGDVTRDQIYDMAGSLTEFTATTLAPYSDPGTWYSTPILHDPIFPGSSSPASRGGAWWLPQAQTLLPVRNTYTGNGLANYAGFRCAYTDES